MILDTHPLLFACAWHKAPLGGAQGDSERLLRLKPSRFFGRRIDREELFPSVTRVKGGEPAVLSWRPRSFDHDVTLEIPIMSFTFRITLVGDDHK